MAMSSFEMEPMVAPMGCVLGRIAQVRSRDERLALLNSLITAVDFYTYGRDVGYREGLKAAGKETE